MKTMWKRLTAAALLTLCVGMLAGCGGEDRVGVVDLERVRKEAPLVQKYKEKTEEKQKSVTEDASMQRQFMSDIQTNLGEIAKEKEVGIVMVKEAVPNGGIDVTDELIAKLQ